ncbi:MAG: LPS-assembly protein LptD, partial [Candidatus Omnitrophica bacterium]|nr:LPS-assembly protein LptD [Candidatus Omnitrophota bacterium]
MKKIFIGFLFLTLNLTAFGQSKMIPVIVDGDEISYLKEEGRIVAKGNVKMNYKGAELYCDEGTYNVSSNNATIKGNIKIIQDGSTLYGEDGVYDFNTNDAQVFSIRVEQPPIYGEAKKGNKIGKEKNVLEQGYFTTCNLQKPHYRICAKQIIIYPGERVVGKNVVFKVGEVPIFYFPYISQSFNDKSFIAEASIGKEKDWGYYLLTRWRYGMNNENRGKFVFDWYANRGQGIGVEHKIETKNAGEALLKYYQIKDKYYESDAINREKFFERFPERENIDAKYLEDDRYKIQISYDWQA